MEKYNGWKNYETWLFNLHYGDFLYEEYKDIKEMDSDLDAVEFVKNFIESFLLDELPQDMHGFFSDAINAFIERVDVHEIAEHLLED